MTTAVATSERVTEDGEVVSMTLPTTFAAGNQSLAVNLARAEIDQQIATARAMPRSLKHAVDNILTLATLDAESAEECVYALPRGGKPIKGPSVRLAEIIASQWGNCRVGARVVHVDRFEKFVEAEGVFHDLETNTATTARVRRRISDKNGRVFNDDMIVVTGNAACAIAKRNAILGAVPKAVWRKSYQAVESVIAGDVKTLVERREKAMKAFAAFGVKPDQVLAAIAVAGLEEIGIDHLTTLMGMHSALKSGEATVEEMFPKQPATGERPKNLAEAMDALAAVPAEDSVTADHSEQPETESEVVPSDATSDSINRSDAAPLPPEEQSATGGAETSPPARSSDEPHAATGAPDAKTLADYDTDLATAAKSGTEALQKTWATVPAGMKRSLKAALDRRHKPTADAADADAHADGGEKQQDDPAQDAELAARSAPAADEPKDAPPTDPKTADEYVTYARAWFCSVTDAETARARWTAEKKLRNWLNLDPDMRDTLKDELEAKIAARR